MTDKHDHFKIAPSNINWASFVHDYYDNHGTYHEGDAGIDLFCPETVEVPANARGFMYNLQIRVCYVEWYIEKDDITVPFWLLPRSSTGKNTPLRLSNSVGLIDAQYRGCLCALLDNLSNEPFIIEKGTRLFQIATRTLDKTKFFVVEKLDDTLRGNGGFGSTGK